jgi:DNA-directed RNA polymerase specialized sigma24 family protein
MSGWGRYLLLDPSDLERMFSEEDSLAEMPSVWEELHEEGQERLAEVRLYLDRIPAREADFIELYFFLKLRQTSIAEMFNVSQPTVCYRLQRGAARIRFLMELPEFDPEKMGRDLRGVLQEEVDARIMERMVATTCQSDVARELGVTQGYVRYRFFRTIERLRMLPAMRTYVEVFEKVAENFNILKDTCRSEWGDEVIYAL